MKKFLLIIPALFILGSLSLAQVFSITSYNNTIDIQDQNSINETISFTVMNSDNTTLSLLTYNLEQNPNNLAVFQDGSSLPFNISQVNGEYQIAISTSIQPNESKNFTLQFNPTNLVSRLDDKYVFRLDFLPEKPIANFQMKVILPEGTGLTTLQGLPIVSPRPYTLETDGQRIIINWDRPTLNETFSILVEYESLSQSNNFFPDSLLALLLVSAIIFVVGFFAGNKIKAYRKRELIKTVLSEDENTIFKAVEKEGEILQNKLPEMTGFSKTKISKIVRNLETKNAVQKIPYKKTNKLKIKK